MKPSILKRLFEIEAKTKSIKPSAIDWESWVLEKSGLTREEHIAKFGSFSSYAYHLMLSGVSRTGDVVESPSTCGSASERYKSMLNG